MPKAKPYPDSPDSEEEEKTTAESQWEDEASTTVEQGEVAEKIRGLVEPRRNITNITNTGASSAEESTVDDQNAHPLLVNTPASRDTPVRAHLVVAQGNEAGQEVVLVPGKTHTIGRATDNDFVLTDIAVSRKHFDLRHEDGAWVIVDRGSGNGTVVNGNIEDNPFMLANGDLIEIGNTVFRFEDPNGVPRRPVPYDMQGDGDDDEMSTVAGKPMRQAFDEPPALAPPQMPHERPKTLPPPTPIRPHSPSAQPYMPAQSLASTLPMPQMAARQPPLAPASAPGAPTMLGIDQMHGMPLPGVVPTTMPGHAQGLPPHVTPGRAMQMYPQASEIPPHSVHAQMLKITANAGRMDPSTAHVAPVPYAMPMQPAPMAASFSVAQPMSKRAKYAIGAAALSVLAAVSTIAIMKAGSGKSGTAAAAATSTSSGSTLGTASLKVEPVRVAAAPAPPPTPTPTPTPPAPAPEPQKVAPTPAPPPPPEPAKETPKVEKKKEIAAAKQSPKRPTPAPPPPREEVRAAPTPPPPPRETPKRDPADAVKQANAAYAAKKWQEAESILTSAAKTASTEDARNLRHQADNIEQFYRAYNVGMAPGSGQATVQFDKLRTARSLDNALGKVFNGEIENKLKEIAPRAASTYMGNREFDKALIAVEAAESLGSSDANISMVRARLTSEANKLYADAASKADSDPKTAREELRKLKTFVDKKISVGDKADKLLKQLDK